MIPKKERDFMDKSQWIAIIFLIVKFAIDLLEILLKLI